jgi:hypothetical protein
MAISGTITGGFLTGRQPSQIDPAILLPRSTTPLFSAVKS